MNSNRLAGHELPNEGRLWGRIESRYVTGPGRARCTCGEKSPRLPSANARKRWHREHKDAIRQEQPARLTRRNP